MNYSVFRIENDDKLTLLSSGTADRIKAEVRKYKKGLEVLAEVYRLQWEYADSKLSNKEHQEKYEEWAKKNSEYECEYQYLVDRWDKIITSILIVPSFTVDTFLEKV